MHRYSCIYDVLEVSSSKCSDIVIIYVRKRHQFAIRGSVMACLNIVFRHCCIWNRTLRTTKFQTYVYATNINARSVCIFIVQLEKTISSSELYLSPRPKPYSEILIMEIDFLGESCYNINMCKNKAFFCNFSLQIKTYFYKWK